MFSIINGTFLSYLLNRFCCDAANGRMCGRFGPLTIRFDNKMGLETKDVRRQSIRFGWTRCHFTRRAMKLTEGYNSHYIFYRFTQCIPLSPFKIYSNLNLHKIWTRRCRAIQWYNPIFSGLIPFLWSIFYIFRARIGRFRHDFNVYAKVTHVLRMFEQCREQATCNNPKTNTISRWEWNIFLRK